MSFDDIANKLGNMDEERMEELVDEIDQEQVNQGLQRLLNMFVAPHLVEIREKSGDYPDKHEVREAYKNMPEGEQQETFEEAMDHLMMAATVTRHRPTEGFQMFTDMLRDPTTTEALLLMFENEHIDPEYRDHLKEFASVRLHWLGVLFIPEMYTHEEAEPVLRRFDPHSPDPEPQ